MRVSNSNIVKIKRLKKDGSIDPAIITRIASLIKKKKVVVLPVDNVYGLVGISGSEVERKISRALTFHEDFVQLISSFKMLNDIVTFTKFDYDFLNRVWPGEVNVILNNKKGKSEKKCSIIRFPKNKFLRSVIDTVDRPLIVAKAYKRKNTLVYRQSDIIKLFTEKTDMIVVIEELCKKHPVSTVIDISKGELMIVREGKVPIDEIKSLYFLGKDDDLVY